VKFLTQTVQSYDILTLVLLMEGRGLKVPPDRSFAWCSQTAWKLLERFGGFLRIGLATKCRRNVLPIRIRDFMAAPGTWKIS